MTTIASGPTAVACIRASEVRETTLCSLHEVQGSNGSNLR